MFAIMQGQQ